MEEAARGGSLSMPSSQASTARKEWRAVSEHSSRSAGNEVRQGQELHDAMNFCSIQIDGIGGLDDDSEQMLQNLAKERDELQQKEIQLRSHMIARSAIVEMKKSCDSKVNEQAELIVELQEQIDERDQRIMALESNMEDKERELHAIRRDNEAAWAKEDLLREQNQEIANFRRERDNVEAERAHRMKQIHDFQEHVQEKDRQMIELQEQHRIAQETLLFKEDQLREAQTWITRAQEMDALQSSTNHSLQAELRERTEQYNQLWLGYQRQFMEMERLHMQTVQQLQHELSEARGKSGTCNGESRAIKAKSNDISEHEQNDGNHLEANGSYTSSENPANPPNGHSENSHSIALPGNASTQTNHVPGVPIAPQSLLGVASYLPPGQVTVHPYVMHQQGANQSVPASIPQSYVGHFPTTTAITSYQQWQGEQAAADIYQGSVSRSEADNNPAGFVSGYSCETSINGQDLHPDHLNTHSSQGIEASSAVSSTEVFASVDKDYLTSQGQANLQKISSQFHEVLGLTSVGQSADIKEFDDAQDNDVNGLNSDKLESRAVRTDQIDSSESPLPSDKLTKPVSFSETKMDKTTDGAPAEVSDSVGQINTLPPKGISGAALLDERSLLSCIVRTIPAGGKIRISSTLPNRLGKMLAPLHWHDYKKMYGKLDDFVASHPELFLIEGDSIQLREGAQGIIAATAAVAKVAAAAASSPHMTSVFPSVALTPMAQANRSKKNPSAELNCAGNGDLKVNGPTSERKLNPRSGANVSKQQGRTRGIPYGF